MRRLLALSVFSAAAAFAAAPSFAPLVPMSPPAGRRSSGAALKSGITDSLLIVGGFSSGGGLSDQHVWRGLSNTWTAAGSATSPRERHGLAYEPRTDRFVVFGGVNGFTVLGTAYLVDGQAFGITSPALPTTRPSARADPVLQWIPPLQRFLAFGGRTSVFSNAFVNDSWTLDVSDGGLTWTALATPTAPSGRGATCNAWDPVREQLLLFGGEAANNLGDTWSFKADAGWQQLTVTNAPPARSFAGCAWDPNLGELVLYGGQTATAAVAGLFTFNPATNAWTTHALPALNPGALSDLGAVYSPQFGGVLLFGGRNGAGDYVNDLWLLTFNQPPSVDAGPGFSIAEAALAMLSGSVTDGDGDPVTFFWQQAQGPTVTLSDAGALNPSFAPPRVFVATPLRFRLTGSDGTTQATSDVVVTVNDTINEPPSVDAGPDQGAMGAASVTLQGFAVDPNGEVLALQWSQVAGPSVTLSSTTVPTPTFVAPTLAALSELRFRLSAVDPRSGAAEDVVSIFVQASVGPADAGLPDAGGADAGTGVLDAGTPDAGGADGGGVGVGPFDAGPADAGGSDAGGADAGTEDAGAHDAGAADAGRSSPDAGAVAFDGGVETDAGVDALVPTRSFAVGCSCAEVPGGLAGLWLALAWWARGRSTRRLR